MKPSVLIARIARLFHRTPRTVDLSRFIAEVHATARQGRAREAVMRELAIASHSEYRRLAHAALKIDPELPYLPVTRRYRTERTVGKGGVVVPLAACIEVGLLLGTRVELRAGEDNNTIEIAGVERHDVRV